MQNVFLETWFSLLLVYMYMYSHENCLLTGFVWRHCSPWRHCQGLCWDCWTSHKLPWSRLVHQEQARIQLPPPCCLERKHKVCTNSWHSNQLLLFVPSEAEILFSPVSHWVELEEKKSICRSVLALLMFFVENKPSWAPIEHWLFLFPLLLKGDAQLSPLPGSLTIHRLSINLRFNFLCPMTSFCWFFFW